MEGWQVPPHPEQRAHEARRGRRLFVGGIGVTVGVVANAVLLVLALSPGLAADDGFDLAYAGLAFIFYSGLASLLLLGLGGILCIPRVIRPLGVGLLIGTAAGLITTNGVCFAVLALAA